MQDKDDGIFYMELEQFRTFFSEVEVLYFNEGFKYQATKKTMNKRHALYFSIMVPKKGEYYFSAIQTDARFFKSQPNFEYSCIRILIGRQDEDTQKYEFVDA